MAQTSLEQVMEEVKALTPAEQRQLHDWLATMVAPAPLTEEAFARHLVAVGLLSELPRRLTDLTSSQDRQPVATSGPPLSEVILEERR
jgi:hypothetical protein